MINWMSDFRFETTKQGNPEKILGSCEICLLPIYIINRKYFYIIFNILLYRYFYIIFLKLSGYKDKIQILIEIHGLEGAQKKNFSFQKNFTLHQLLKCYYLKLSNG